jgi:shikimate kinase
MRIIDIIEGRFDPYNNKAIFFAGGAGSGKTFISRKLASVFYGLKQVNPDQAFKYLLKKTNLNVKMPPEEEYFRDRMRQRSKNIAGKVQQTYQKSNLGMIIDTTGRSYRRIDDTKKELEQQGYDTAMVFVNADIQTQLMRNKQRERQVPEKVILDNSKLINQNLGKYQRLFGNNFFIIDNSNKNQSNITQDLAQLESQIRAFLQSNK